MCRSNWKGNFITRFLLKKVTKDVKVWSRNSVVPSNLIGLYAFIHNGKNFKKLLITREKVGFKFGDFAFTRKYISKKKIVKTNISKKIKK